MGSASRTQALRQRRGQRQGLASVARSARQVCGVKRQVLASASTR